MKITEHERFQELKKTAGNINLKEGTSYFDIQEYFDRFEKARTAWVNTIKTHGYRAVYQTYGISINTLQRLVKGEPLRPSTRDKIIRIYEEIRDNHQ